MYAHLLVPTDGSKLSDKAVAHAIALAQATGAQITAYHATPGPPESYYGDGLIAPLASRKDFDKRAKESAGRVLNKVAAKAKAAGVPCTTLWGSSDTPWKAIIAAAKKAKADTIVMASHGRGGLSGLLLGSETTKVLAHSKLPVLVVR
jgi:nucleotide-binding universal stress UspA family protein